MTAARWGCLVLLMGLLNLWPTVARAWTVQLQWTAPTENTDGSPLTDLAGHQVYFGQASGVYGGPVDVGLETSAAVQDLPDGTWYFAVTAYNDALDESEYSAEATVTLPPGTEPDTTPPTVAIVPFPGGTVPRKTTVTIEVQASDDVGVVEVRVMARQGTTVIHSCLDTLAPYTCAWPVPAANRAVYTLVATAMDAAGHVGTSAPVQVTAQ